MVQNKHGFLAIIEYAQRVLENKKRLTGAQKF
jgi:hypothetical protein